MRDTRFGAARSNNSANRTFGKGPQRMQTMQRATAAAILISTQIRRAVENSATRSRSSESMCSTPKGLLRMPMTVAEATVLGGKLAHHVAMRPTKMYHTVMVAASEKKQTPNRVRASALTG